MTFITKVLTKGLLFFALREYLCRMDAIFQLQQIDKIAELLWKENKAKKIWAFYAPMGAGKTTMVHALCELWKIKDAVSSPTFAIINEYKSEVIGKVCHMDWYRLKDEDEAVQAGVEDALLSSNICLIEWPEKAEGLLPDDTLQIHIEVLDAATRRIFTHAD